MTEQNDYDNGGINHVTLNLTDDEAIDLVVALDHLTESSSVGAQENIQSIQDKIAQSLDTDGDRDD